MTFLRELARRDRPPYRAQRFLFQPCQLRERCPSLSNAIRRKRLLRYLFLSQSCKGVSPRLWETSISSSPRQPWGLQFLLLVQEPFSYEDPPTPSSLWTEGLSFHPPLRTFLPTLQNLVSSRQQQALVFPGAWRPLDPHLSRRGPVLFFCKIAIPRLCYRMSFLMQLVVVLLTQV